MYTIDIPVKINQTVKVEVHVEEIAEAVNELSRATRMNFIAKILNEIELEDLDESLEDNHKEVILGWLKRTLKKLDSVSKEELEKIVGQKWEKVNNQFENRNSGVNPHAYRLGFLDGFKYGK